MTVSAEMCPSVRRAWVEVDGIAPSRPRPAHVPPVGLNPWGPQPRRSRVPLLRAQPRRSRG
jgi:hypothetical protein